MHSNMFSTVKKTLKNTKNNAFDFCKDHKCEIVEGTVIIGLTMGCCYLANRTNNQGKVITKLLADNDSLIAKNKNLVDQLDFKNKYNEYLSRRVNELVDLCNRKDEVMKATMSDGLRHGSSVAAQQMAYKRWS